ncbi:hypothetical protein R6Q59_020431 [Mikania micrantha]
MKSSIVIIFLLAFMTVGMVLVMSQEVICERNQPLKNCTSSQCMSMCEALFGRDSQGECKGSDFCHCYLKCPPPM